jgi:hypothetical protein
MSAAVLPLALLFSRDELPRLQRNARHPVFAAWWEQAVAADLKADERWLREELDLSDPVRPLQRAADMLTRSAFVYRLTGDEAHLALARRALDRVLAYPRWDWFLEAGEHTVGIMRNGTTAIAVVLAADWLAERLDAGEFAAIERYLAEEAGPAAQRAVFGMTHHDQVVGWSMNPAMTGFTRVDVSRWPAILDLNNLRIIATSGLAACAAYLHGRHPAAETWAREARDSLRLFASRQPADGAFPEGPSYWHFTYTYFVVTLELLRRRCGHDERGLLDFPAMARYVRTATMPTRAVPDDCVNIGDANSGAGAEALAWIAREFRDGTAQHLVHSPGTVRDAANTAWAIVWFDETVPARPAGDLPLDRVLFPGIVLSRSGWALDDAVLALRSGEPENHEHADRQGLIFAAYGERLIHDPLKASYSPQDPKWLLRCPEAHSAVLIDGRGHHYHRGEEGTNASTARAELLDHRVGPDWMLAVSEAAEAYRQAGRPVERAQRTVLFLKPDIVVVLDRVRLSAARPVAARYQVFNDDGRGAVATDGAGFVVTRPHATLRARVAGTGAVTVRGDRLPLPAEGGVYPFAEVVSPAAITHELLTVATAAPAGEAHGEIAVTRDAEGWHIAGEHRGRRVDHHLVVTADLPSLRP